MSLLSSQFSQCSFSSYTRVILMRHGQSTYNAEKRHQGSSDDSVLTEQGRIAAYQTGLALRESAIDAVYSSPLQRAQETAREVIAAIATAVDTPPDLLTHKALKEISLPLWEGLPYQVVREQFAKEYRCWKERPDQFQMAARAEDVLYYRGTLTLTHLAKPCYPVLELYDRAQQFWQEVLVRHRGETLLVVAHAGTNRALLSTAIGLPPHRFHSLQQSNCGVSVLNFSHSSKQLACLEQLNSTHHLGETLPKLKEGKQGLRLLIIPASGENLHPIQALANRLANVSIDFSISNDLDACQPVIDQLLQHHSNTVQLQVLREDFPQAWQQMLAARHWQKASTEVHQHRPLTALVVVREAIALQLLSQLLDIQPQSLQLIPDTLSIIYYPSSLNTTVLQAMNLA